MKQPSKMIEKKEYNVYYAMVDKGFRMDLRELTFFHRLLIGLAIIRRKIVIISGKNKLNTQKETKTK
jgi:hypothetical protein